MCSDLTIRKYPLTALWVENERLSTGPVHLGTAELMLELVETVGCPVGPNTTTPDLTGFAYVGGFGGGPLPLQ